MKLLLTILFLFTLLLCQAQGTKDTIWIDLHSIRNAFNAIPLKADSTAADTKTGYKAGTMKYTSKSRAIVKAIKSDQDELFVDLVPLKAGKSLISASVSIPGGKPLIKQFWCIVVDNQKATGFRIQVLSY